MLAILAEVHNILGLPPPVLPAAPPDPFPEQIEAVLEARPPVFRFTFAMPGAGVLARLRERGIAILGTATTVEESCMLEGGGVDAVVAQGAEAGGHRGTFAGSFEDSMIPTGDLVQAVAAAVKVPVIAAGSIMDGRDLAAVWHSGRQLPNSAQRSCPARNAARLRLTSRRSSRRRRTPPVGYPLKHAILRSE